MMEKMKDKKESTKNLIDKYSRMIKKSRINGVWRMKERNTMKKGED